MGADRPEQGGSGAAALDPCSADELRRARHRACPAVRARTRSGQAAHRQCDRSLRRAGQFIRSRAADRPNPRAARAAHHCGLLVRNDPQPDPRQHPECQWRRGKAGGENLRRRRRLQRAGGSRHCRALRRQDIRAARAGKARPQARADQYADSRPNRSPITCSPASSCPPPSASSAGMAGI